MYCLAPTPIMMATVDLQEACYAPRSVQRPPLPEGLILQAVRWYCRYPLSYRDVRDMLAERGITVDAATVYRWVQKFGPEIRKRAYRRHRSWRGLTWHVDETYLRVNGRWCYLWRAVDQHGQLIDFRLTARRTANAARAFLRQARETVRIYQPLTIITDKAASYGKVIGEWNARLGPEDAIRQITRKRENNQADPSASPGCRPPRPQRDQ